MRKKVVVIGSGISGLASAIRLASAGFQVEIFEKNSFPGGKIGELRKNGYRFDMGPSLLTLPGLIRELFLLAGENPDHYINFEKLDLSCRYFFDDGIFISAYTNRKLFLGEIQQKTTTQPVDVQRYLDEAEELYELTKNIFIFSPFKQLSTFKTPDAKRLARKFLKLDAFTSLHNRNQKSLYDPKIVQIFDRYATYNGSDPYRAPATLKIISHLEHNLGAFQPKGGMFELVKTLVKLAGRLDIKIHFNSPVDEIRIKNRSVEGITCGNRLVVCDIVISDVDIRTLYKKILRKHTVPWNLKYQELSSSAILLYWGIKKIYTELDIHNILFSGNYREEFRHIFKRKTIYHDPTVYIYISSKLNPGGCPCKLRKLVCYDEYSKQYRPGLECTEGNRKKKLHSKDQSCAFN